MSKFIQEFKQFAIRGNVVDMAVGIIIGAAFGKIVSSLVSDLLMPLVGALAGGVNFTDWKWTIVGERVSMLDPDIILPAVTLNYGNFIQVLIDFIIIAFCVFLLIKGINKLTSLKKKEKVQETPVPAPEPEPTREEVLLTQIRDLLKK
ncbi:MAG: large-conductance mechanosensitive channel protein MscL [Bacteroidales bacterium]|jgi:large conductance mechanosensitive channel|nr:large-conductance mechanosensitive channel protein MscL [Bacteroidales bacterium]MDD2263902.1 large-conductance mechanosensitive channel protein MscL [Bacteroidales bacterium]MDD2831136.1 large-conductance mechanosensitive channel protein MscL [Bacteroidales bacterium]MDD3209247.1 large-conductance mechanosensitive channel protein MscL [Bacteroidales bacterium]MDD3697626.1 large-conductance mechanosensitive channel protein MscL [Bacteroidales bacterium]